MKFNKMAVVTVLLLAVVAIFAAPRSTKAELGNEDWFSRATPQVTKMTDYPNGRPSLVTNDYCDDIVEMNGSKWCSKESNIGKIVNGRLIEGSKSTSLKGYNGNGGIDPVPNNPLFITTRSGSGGGQYLGFYRHLDRSDLDLKSFYGLPPRWEYQVKRDADYWLTDDTGRGISVNTSTMAFSRNGYWVVFDAPHIGLMRVNIATMNLVLFAPSVEESWYTSTYNRPVTISDDGRYAAVANGNSLNVYDVDSCVQKGFTYDMPRTYDGCKSHDIWNGYYSRDAGSKDFGVKTNIDNGVVLGNLRFVNNGNIRFDARYGAVGSYKYAPFVATAPGATLHNMGLLAMGDSFISGEGAYKYREGTDTTINRCHQSLVSYPYLLSHSFNSFASVACSGAVVDNIIGNDGGHNDYQEEVKSNAEANVLLDDARAEHFPGVSLQNYFLDSDNPEAVILSIGGNDVGFTEIVTRCVAPFNVSLKPVNISFSNNCYETYEDRYEVVKSIHDQFDNLFNTYNQIINQTDRRLYVVGYPQVVSVAGSCEPNVRLSQSDREFAVQLVDYLDGVIAAAAKKAGAYYVDTQDAFDGHRLCEGQPFAMNGLTEGTDKMFVIGTESYHPTEYGHQLSASVIASKTRNLTAPMPAADASVQAPPITDDMPILQAPKVNRAIYELVNAGKDLTGPWLWGHLLHTDLSQVKGSVKSNTLFDIVLHSDPVSLGQVRSDANGVITADLALPANIPAGFHTLHFYGKNIAGDNIDIQKLVYVGASANDYDGDGIPNSDESSCMYIPNSGEDYDKDGIDDACDGNITEPPAVTVTNPTVTDSIGTHTTMFDPAFATAQSSAAGSTVQAAASAGYFQSDTTNSTAIDAPTGSEPAGYPAVLGTNRPEAPKPTNHHVWISRLTAVLLALGLVVLILRGATVRLHTH